MDRKTYFSAYLWAGSNFILILAITVVQCILMQWLVLAIAEDMFSSNSKIPFSNTFLICNVCVSSIVTITFLNSAKYNIQNNFSKYHQGSSKPDWLGQVVKDTCAMRGHHVPEIYIIKKRSTKQSTMTAAIVDLLGKPDCLIVGEDLFRLMSREQILGIISHELRHSNATENLFRLIIMAFYFVVSGTVLLLCYAKVLSFWHPAVIWLLLAISWLHAFANSRHKNRLSKIILIATVALLLIPLLWNFWSSTVLLFKVLGILFCSHLLNQLTSRAKEYKTDILAAIDMGTARPLINSLDHIHNTLKREALPDQLERYKFFNNPIGELFSTHPPIAKRISVMSKIFARNQKLKPYLTNALLKK